MRHPTACRHIRDQTHQPDPKPTPADHLARQIQLRDMPLATRTTTTGHKHVLNHWQRKHRESQSPGAESEPNRRKAFSRSQGTHPLRAPLPPSERHVCGQTNSYACLALGLISLPTLLPIGLHKRSSTASSKATFSFSSVFSAISCPRVRASTHTHYTHATQIHASSL